jgi:prepilin-type N-terminal cleavage/methylation domain-containing protein
MVRGGMRMAGRTTITRGFTLVEILIVVLILGILAAISIPGYVGAMDRTARGTFVADLKTFGDAAALYYSRTGGFLEDADSGVLPSGFGEYIDAVRWTGETPIGGLWDAEHNDAGGVESAVGVDFNGAAKVRDDAYMLEIDETFDDGDLSTGMFRKLGEGLYYYIVEE